MNWKGRKIAESNKPPNPMELPKYLVEKENHFWIIWNTELSEKVGTFETKEQAEQTLKTLTK